MPSILPMPIGPSKPILPLARLLFTTPRQFDRLTLRSSPFDLITRIIDSAPDIIARSIRYFPLIKSLREGLLLPHLFLPRLPHSLQGLGLPHDHPEMYRSTTNRYSRSRTINHPSKDYFSSRERVRVRFRRTPPLSGGMQSSRSDLSGLVRFRMSL